MQIKVIVCYAEEYRGSERVRLANSVSTQELVFRLSVGEIIMFIIQFSFLERVSASADA